MIFNINSEKGSRLKRSLYIPTIKSLLVSALILTGIHASVQAQDTIRYTKPSWYFGAAAGAAGGEYLGEKGAASLRSGRQVEQLQKEIKGKSGTPLNKLNKYEMKD